MTGPLERLRAEIERHSTDPYLLSVTADHEPHCGTVSMAWAEAAGQLVVTPPPSSWAGSEAAGHCEVSLLWPPLDPGGYSLIVDCTARVTPNDAGLALTITKAVLHRRGPAPAGSLAPCSSDCLPIVARSAAR